MERVLFESASAARRVEAALRVVSRALDAGRSLMVIAPTREAGRELVRRIALERGACARVEPTTLDAIAVELARDSLLRRHECRLDGTGLDAIVARAIAASPALGRYEAVRDLPGTPRAIARVLEELMLADLAPEALLEVDPALAGLASKVRDELERQRLVPTATLHARATASLHDGSARPSDAVVVLDVPLHEALPAELARAIVRGAADALVTVASGDRRTRARWVEGLDLALELDEGGTRCARDLFSTETSPAGRALERSVRVLSGTTEAEECVELARALLEELDRPEHPPLDRIAIVVRDAERYRVPLTEALTRAGIPHHLERGVRRPDPAGRAFLSLLECAGSGLSAHAFADYLAFGVLPKAGDAGAPGASADRRDAPDRGVKETLEEEDEGGDETKKRRAVVGGALRAPRRWERLLVDASVIGGGPERWRRRLEGLRAELTSAIARARDPDSPEARRAALTLADLERLSSFALPLIERLAALPKEASWAVMLPALEALARASLVEPRRVLEVLAQLAPLARMTPPLGPITPGQGAGGPDEPITLDDVRRVLLPRLREIQGSPLEPAGAVRVISAEAIAGRELDLVLVPGLVERAFPRRILEDPILSDDARAAIAPRASDAVDDEPRSPLRTTADRADDEQLLLRRIAQAAPRLICSHPRRDERNRARAPSLYLLELVRADRGELVSALALARERSLLEVAPGWPAPRDPARAIDRREADLSTIAALLGESPAAARGRAAHLTSESPVLGRALRARHGAHGERWGNQDGLLSADPATRKLLERERPGARVFSATALESFAACPYRFFLRAVVRLEAREVVERVETLDPATRGTLIHATQFALVTAAHAEGLSVHRDEEVLRGRLSQIVDEVASEARDRLVPAIESVFDDEIRGIRRDLLAWLHHLAQQTRWSPAFAELGFGSPPGGERDAASVPEPVAIEVPRHGERETAAASGVVTLKLRGAIDLVERSETTLRVTDYKTGRAHASPQTVIGGGETLQPLLYALVLESMLSRGLLSLEGPASPSPALRVEGGRLWYCTARGENRSVSVTLDDEGRRAIGHVLTTLDRSLERALLPRAPRAEACSYCDYVAVCGPHAEARASRKERTGPVIEPLLKLRSEK